jgi:hypothetical protein
MSLTVTAATAVFGTYVTVAIDAVALAAVAPAGAAAATAVTAAAVNIILAPLGATAMALVGGNCLIFYKVYSCRGCYSCCCYKTVLVTVVVVV